MLAAVALLAALTVAQTDPPEQSPDRPAACSGSAMAFDRARETLVLFDGGGRPSCGPARQQTWLHDGASWRLALDGEGPTSRAFHAMAFDEARGVVLLYGGLCRETERTCGDAWVWDGDAWTEIPVEGPGPRYGAVLAYDPEAQVVLLYGGRDELGIFRDVWSWDGEAWTRRWSGYRGL